MTSSGTHGYISVTELAVSLGVQPDTLRQWLRRRHRDETQTVDRLDGGKALLVSPLAQDLARQRYGTVTQRDTTGHVQPDEQTVTATQRDNDAPPAPERHQSAQEGVAALIARAEAAEAGREALARENDTLRQELEGQRSMVQAADARATAAEAVGAERSAQISSLQAEADRVGEGWREAIRQATDRATAAEARLVTVEARVVELERRADVLETQLRRSRDEADRWRTRADEVLGSWHAWRRALDGVGRWRLVRRKFPAEPVEFTGGPAIAAPVE